MKRTRLVRQNLLARIWTWVSGSGEDHHLHYGRGRNRDRNLTLRDLRLRSVTLHLGFHLIVAAAQGLVTSLNHVERNLHVATMILSIYETEANTSLNPFDTPKDHLEGDHHHIDQKETALSLTEQRAHHRRVPVIRKSPQGPGQTSHCLLIQASMVTAHRTTATDLDEMTLDLERVYHMPLL
jgi:hypothetical protein